MKRTSQYRSKFILLLLVALTYACTEEIPLKTENFESFLVVEGIITNQDKQQEVKLSRSYQLDERTPVPVTGAQVKVVTGSGDSFNFIEEVPGRYLSENTFSTTPGESYRLDIQIGEDRYTSSEVQAVEKTSIESIQSTRSVVKGEEGVAILVSSGDETSSNYYKYEYEETYEIVSFYKKSHDLIINEEGEFEVVPKSKEEYICYNTEKSRELVLSSTENLGGESFDDYLVRFIPKTDSKLAHRYSILVKQLRLNPDIYEIYQTLENLSESENVFSQYQPGFLNGNIVSLDDENESVIGIFTTAAVDEKRLFFSYTDYFNPDEDSRPTHYGPCANEAFVLEDDLLRKAIRENSVKLFAEDPPGIYKVINPRCVDCTYFGTNVKPDFWED